MSDIIQPTKPQPQLQLPFKPFTIAQVSDITEADARVIEAWVGEGDKKILQVRHGSGETGLDYTQTFALYVGWKYLYEGVPAQRAVGVVQYLASLSVPYIERELSQGNNFPVPGSLDRKTLGPGCMVKAPDSPLGRRLKLDKLLGEFRANVARVFPNG